MKLEASAKPDAVAPQGQAPDPGHSEIRVLETLGQADLPGAVSWAAASRRTRFRQILPFGLLGILAVAMATVPDTDVNRARWLWGATGLLLLSGFQIVLMPWERLSSMWRHLPAVTFCLGVVMLREIDAEGTTGFGVLLLLPIIWQAVYGRRIDMALAFAQILFALAVPVMVFDGYPVRQEVPRTILLLAVAAALGVVLRSLIGTVRSHDQTMQTVVAVSRLLNRTDDPLGVLGAGIRELTAADSVLLTLSTPSGQATSGPMVVVEPGRSPDSSMVEHRLEATTSQIDPTALEGEAVFERRPTTDDADNGPAGAERGTLDLNWPPQLAARLLVPIGPFHQPVGVAEARWLQPPRRPSTFVRSAIGLLGVDASRALDRLDRMEVLDDQAHRDGLTALPNRRAWDELIEHEINLARRSGHPLSVAVMDLDRFKLYNDEFGHLAGDDLLRDAAAAWSHALRSPDVLARWGGEEFVVALPNTEMDEALRAIERLQKATPGEQTFSAGVAVLTATDTADTVVAAADAAMYQAKASGRNRVLAAKRDRESPIV